MIRFDTFATAIVDQFQSAYNSPAANMLGGVLVACCLFLLGLEILLRGNERYARVGSGSARPADRRRLGWFVVPAILLPAVLAVLTLGVPLVTLGRWLYLGGADIWRLDTVGNAFIQTIVLAVAGGVLATIAAAPMAWLSVRAPGRFQRVLEACHYYVGSLPGVVVALALVTITVRVALPLYQTFATLARRLCPTLPAARHGRSSRQHRTGAGRTGAGRHGSWTYPVAGRAPDYHAACRPRLCCERCAIGTRHHQRIDGNADVVAERR